MASATPQPTDKPGGWYHFKESNYLTWFTDWMMKLGGKGAHAVLIVTTLYMSAELFPGVNTPPTLNLAVFLLQMFMLDMGGLGLLALARSARERGNTEGATQATRLGRFLIGIMIAGIVTASTGQALSNLKITPDVQDWINAIKTAIEIILVVARSFCAVFYGVAIHSLRDDQANHQQAQQDLQQENEALTATVASLRKQMEDYQHSNASLRKDLTSTQQGIVQLQKDLGNEQTRSGSLQEELSVSLLDAATLRKQLNATLIDIDTTRAQLAGKDLEIESLKQTLTGSTEMQESRVKQLLSVEQEHAARLQSQLQTEQETTLSLRQQLNSTNLQVIDLTSKLEEAGRKIEKLQDAETQNQDLTARLEKQEREQQTILGQKERAILDISARLQEVNLQNDHLQKQILQVQDLPAKLAEKESELSRVLSDLQSAKSQIRELKTAKSQPAKPSDQPAKITSIETAKRERISHADVIAYMEANPGMKRAEVAANLVISERKVYDALAWKKQQEEGVAEA